MVKHEEKTSCRIVTREFLLLLGILFLTMAMRLTFLHEPFERDEGIYSYLGQELLRGAIPYKELMDIKPPGIMALYAAMIGIFSLTSSEGIRLVTACYALGTVITVYWFARYLAGRSAGLWAALFCGIFSSGPLIQGSSSNSETFLILPLTASAFFLVLWLDQGKPIDLVLAGALAASATLIKTVTLPFLMLSGIMVLLGGFRRWDTVKGRKAGFAGAVGSLVLFAAVPLIMYAALLWYFTRHNAMDDALYWNYYVLKTYGRTPPQVFWLIMKRGIGEVYKEHLLLWIIALPASVYLVRRELSYRSFFVVLLIPAAFVGLSMPGKFFPHYFIQLIPFLSLMAGIGISALFCRQGWLLIAATPFMLTGLVFWVMVDYDYFFRLTPEQVCLKKYETSGPDFVSAVEVARFLRERSRPGDYTYQWHFEPQIYFLSGLRSPNPYYNSYMTMELVRDPALALREVDTSLREKKPRFIVASARSMEGYGWEVVRRVVFDQYRFERKIGNYIIFYLRQ